MVSMLTGRIGAKNLCHISTYFGFMTTFYILQTFYPQLLFVYVVLSWMVSAMYLNIIPFPLWVKTRLMVEATKIPSINIVAKMKVGLENALVRNGFP